MLYCAGVSSARHSASVFSIVFPSNTSPDEFALLGAIAGVASAIAGFVISTDEAGGAQPNNAAIKAATKIAELANITLYVMIFNNLANKFSIPIVYMYFDVCFIPDS